MDHKDTTDPGEMLQYIMQTCCNTCCAYMSERGVPAELRDCKKCRANRYYRKLTTNYKPTRKGTKK